MSKTWLIARHHLGQETGKRTFFLVLFSLPAFLVLTIGMGFLIARLGQEQAVLGYVDQAGLLVRLPAQTVEDGVRLVSFDSPEAARAALEAEQIDAYYVLPPSLDGQTELVYVEPPPAGARRHFVDAVRLNLLAGRPPEVVARLMSRPSLTVQAIEAGREFPGGGPNAGYFLPLVAAVIFSFLVLTTSGYMMGVIVTEKENRTMEVLVTSVSPGQMMAGKIAGALGIAAIQLAVWLAFVLAAVWLGRGPLGIGWLQDLAVNWRDVGAIVVVALPFYFCIAALMTLVGTALVDGQEASQAGGLFFIPLFLPFYLIVPLAQNPNGPLALGLSLFPVTSVMTMAVRSLFIEIPAWQVAAAAGIALVCGIVLVWLAARAFRMGMLRYGKRLRLGELFGRGAPA
jgi:ABC-2 type transport system permease protein